MDILNILPSKLEDVCWLIGAVGGIYFLVKGYRHRKRSKVPSASTIPPKAPPPKATLEK